MKLLKPTWVHHDGNPIFSLDIHPDGSRLASGGQGEDSGLIIIWNMNPIRNEEYEMDEKIPKVLCQMDNHLACVNCVRWSCNGKYLASGGDDKVIMIWQLCGSSAGSQVFGSNIIIVESWKCVATLRGHGGDILDLAWSPHNAWLASCSVDNTIMVWNALKWPDQIAILKGHSSLVKGVAWDPVGKYLASQSDDKSLKIWRTSDWKQEKTIVEPFSECGGTTHVLRLNWSPDGQYLVSAHSMNNGAPTAQIVERVGWRSDKDFVGHRKAITCVRFCPNILQSISRKSNKNQNYCCCAIGSRDKSISVWLTALKRPLVVIQELFSNSILDLTWSIYGTELLACSWDGTVAYVEFTEQELGKALSQDEKTVVHQRMYGKYLAITNNIQPEKDILIENPEFLKLQENSKFCNSVEPNTSQEIKKKIDVIKGPLDKQIETRTPDGRRRITPIFIPPVFQGVPFNDSSSKPTFSSSTESKSKIVIEHRNCSTDHNKTHEENTLIEPVSIQTKQQSENIPEVPKDKLTLCSNKRKPDNEKDNIKLYKRGRTTAKLPSIPISTKETHQVSPKHEMFSSVSGVHIPSLKLNNKISIQLLGSCGLLEAENNIYSFGNVSVHQMQLINNKKVCWQVLLPMPICAISGSLYLCVAACEDNTIHIFSHTGNRLFPPLIVSGAIGRLCMKEWFLMVLTSNEDIYVWNFHLQQLLIKETLHELADSNLKVTVVKSWLTDKGNPVLSLSSGKTVFFHFELRTWMLFYNCNNSVQQNAEQDIISQYPQGILHHLPLLLAQVETKSRIGGDSKICRTNPAIQQVSTISHLDCQIAASLMLSSTSEYRFWLLIKVRYLCQQQLETQLRNICNDLLGPIYHSLEDKNSWTSNILGLSKLDLLQDILDIISTNSHLQRIYIEYHDLYQLKRKK